MADGSDDDKPGYRKPPRKHQFKKGQSGNPQGRPKGKPTVADDFRLVLAMPVTIEEGGKKRKISTQRALFIQMRRATLGGDARARREFLDLIGRYGSEQQQAGLSDLLAEDERLLAALRKSLKADGQDDEGTS